jgi:glyoxylase-like metal-dependent hydrolase (beta-lactamase superfamily II)
MAGRNNGAGGEMASQVELKSFSVGPMDNNVYILIDTDTRASILFDAPVNANRILAALEGTNLQYILFTHADGDHVEALQDVKQATAAPVGIDAREAFRLPLEPDLEIHDGDVFHFGNSQVRAISTPGHSPGGVSFLADGILIAGDTLFPGGPGNTQRPDGDFKEIIENIRSKLFTLPDDTKVYPGHGKPTTIGAERPHLPEWIQRGS